VKLGIPKSIYMNEFDIIEKFFQCHTTNRSDVVLGSGDDCALLKVPTGNVLAVSIDTLLPDVHFPNDWNGYDTACKAIACALSDLAAMGAQPAWFICSLTLPNLNLPWIEAFANGLFDFSQRYNVALVGGDLTRGKSLSITITVHGFVPAELALRRDAAKVGESIYVSGKLGEPIYTNYHHIPLPQIELGLALRGKSLCAIDISDGLAADLSHILTASHVGARIDLAALPMINDLNSNYAEALTGGDDYQLCFTAAPGLVIKGHEITPIGVVEKELGLRLYAPDGSLFHLKKMGYQHF
jgi:thiamine-monophosphate kinase